MWESCDISSHGSGNIKARMHGAETHLADFREVEAAKGLRDGPDDACAFRILLILKEPVRANTATRTISTVQCASSSAHTRHCGAHSQRQQHGWRQRTHISEQLVWLG